MSKKAIVPIETMWTFLAQERGIWCWPTPSFWMNLTSELTSPSVKRAVAFPIEGLYVFQLPRNSSAAAHSSVIFQVQISRTPVLLASCLDSGSYCLKPTRNACRQHVSRLACIKWDKLLLMFNSPGWHVSREACHVYICFFVIKYYLSCDIAISYLLD